MQVGGITEIIAHFVGELRIALENERVDVLLDGGPSRTMTPDAARVSPDIARPIAEDPFPDDRPALRVDVPLAEGGLFHIKAGLPVLPAIKAFVAPATAPVLPKDVLPALSSGYNLKSYIRFEDGDLTPTQAHVDVEQINAMDDRDVFGPVSPGLELAAEAGALDELVQIALAAGPDGTELLGLKHHEMIDAIARLAHVDGVNDRPSMDLADGTTVDGVRVDPDSPLATAPKLAFANPFEGWGRIDQRPEAPALPEGQQSVETGANDAANVAVLVDVTGQTVSMIVAGDVHRTNTIVQVNVLHDDDHVVHNGAGASVRDSGGNHLGNSATFEDIGVYKSLGGVTGFPGKWTTTVLDGDFYAVQSLVQRNWILDDDVVVRQESTNDFSLVTGHNAGVNNGAFIVNGMSFDMIVIGGSLYSANTIYQHNIMLDDDRVVLSGADGDPLWQLSTGGNSLTNAAWIRDIGSGGFQPMTAAAKATASAVLSGEGQVELGKIAGLAAPGGEALDILVVTGNYYDIRIVSQVNVVGDADTVASLAPRADLDGEGADATLQVIHTGGNSASNLAAIVNVGTLTDTQFAGGQIYEASTLIQTNIITAEASVSVHAFDALAPEVVAFIEHDPYGHGYGAHEDALSQASTLHPVTQNPDVLGSIMT